MSEHRYKLSYVFDPHPEGITKEQFDQLPAVQPNGACDAVLLASILYPADGSLSVLFISRDGRSGEDLADIEWFKIWTMLAARLGESETLDPGKREFARATFETFRRAMSSVAAAEKEAQDS